MLGGNETPRVPFLLFLFLLAYIVVDTIWSYLERIKKHREERRDDD